MGRQDQQSEFGRTTILASNLDPKVTDQLLQSIFSTAGPVRSVKIMHEYGHSSTAHIDYADHASAQTALLTLSNRRIYDLCVMLAWFIPPPRQQLKEDTSQQAFSVFVGDLSPEIDDNSLLEAFTLQCKGIIDARIIYNHETGKSRGFGFVKFSSKQDADRAMELMNGRVIGQRSIRMNWAVQKNEALSGQAMATAAQTGGYASGQQLSFEQPKKPALNFNTVLNQAPPSITTIYIGQLQPGITADMIHQLMIPYGHISELKTMPEKGFAFVKMDSHENAAQAISYLSGALFQGQKLKLSWGRERNQDAQGAPVSYNQATTGYEDVQKFDQNAFLAYQAATLNLRQIQEGKVFDIPMPDTTNKTKSKQPTDEQVQSHFRQVYLQYLAARSQKQQKQ